jgi:SUN domain-containing protein 1/2
MVNIKLSREILVKQVTLEHTSPKLLYNNSISSAPRHVEIWAESKLISKFEFDPRVNHVHTVSVVETFTSVVQVRVVDNWGGDYTCIYRVRVHGDGLING